MGSIISSVKENINYLIYGMTPKSNIDLFLDEYKLFLENSKNSEEFNIELIEIR